MKERVKDLTDFERKLITIVQHFNQEKRSPGLKTLVNKTGRAEGDVQQAIQDLIARKWLIVRDKKLIVRQRLF